MVKTMKILITGAKGQLGSEFKLLCNENLHFTFVDKNALDICDLNAVLKATQGFDALINCAAYTAVDEAENEREKAFAVNETGALNLAKACKEFGTKLIHISTDYVFDGKAYTLLDENAKTAPLGVYGLSKLAGEKAILNEKLKACAIIRTSWLYGKEGKNFVKTIANLATQKDELSVVCDQIGSPTNAKDLARAICELVLRLKGEKTQIFHYANEGVASWFDFAYEIVRILGASCRVLPIKSSEYKSLATRPFYSVFDKSKIKAHFGIQIPHWRESLAEFIKENIKDKK